MSDQPTALPVRSEADGTDERLQSKIVDFTTPAQGMEVDTDNNAHVEIHGHKPDGSTDVVMRLSQLGVPNSDGLYDVTDNSKPSSSADIAHSRDAAPDETKQTLRVTAIAGEANSVCKDVSLHDGTGQYYDQNNPLPVSIEESPGSEICDYQTDAAVAKDASADHDYSVIDGNILLFTGFSASGSGKIKVEVQIGDGAVSEVFATKEVNFNSTANTNVNFTFPTPIKVVGTANSTTVRITLTNRDNSAQDLYSTIFGLER